VLCPASGVSDTASEARVSESRLSIFELPRLQICMTIVILNIVACPQHAEPASLHRSRACYVAGQSRIFPMFSLAGVTDFGLTHPAVLKPGRVDQKQQSERRLFVADDSRDDEPMLFCPRCNSRLTELKCKLMCGKCGYYMSCADYY